MIDDALKSLYGKGHVNATRTRECVTMPGKREQTIFTPQCIIDVVLELYGTIAFDPAYGGPEGIVPAEAYTDTMGLVIQWPDRTYCNPPYGELKLWLAHSLKQTSRHVMLVPVRPHRKWWREWARQADVVYLNPIKFLGYDQAFPAPLCLAERNTGDSQLAKICERHGLGEPI